MRKWLARRFKYTRELKESERFYRRMFEAQLSTNNFLRDLLEAAYPQFNKLTVEEAEEILSACVDYHRALYSLQAADPFQHRVIKIFEKYGIEFEYNDVGKEYYKHLKKRLAPVNVVTY